MDAEEKWQGHDHVLLTRIDEARLRNFFLCDLFVEQFLLEETLLRSLLNDLSQGIGRLVRVFFVGQLALGKILGIWRMSLRNTT